MKILELQKIHDKYYVVTYNKGRFTRNAKHNLKFWSYEGGKLYDWGNKVTDSYVIEHATFLDGDKAGEVFQRVYDAENYKIKYNNAEVEIIDQAHFNE